MIKIQEGGVRYRSVVHLWGCHLALVSMDDVPECPQRQLVAWSDGGPAPHARADFGVFVAALQAPGGVTDILGHLVSSISFLALCRFSHILALCPVGRHFFFSLYLFSVYYIQTLFSPLTEF